MSINNRLKTFNQSLLSNLLGRFSRILTYFNLKIKILKELKNVHFEFWWEWGGVCSAAHAHAKLPSKQTVQPIYKS